MEIIYRENGLSDPEKAGLRRRLEKKKNKIVRLSGRTLGDSSTLRVNVRKVGKPESARVSLTLSLRKGTLFAERNDPDLLTAVDRAVEALIEEIRTFRALYFKEKQRRRHSRVAEELEQAQPYLAEQAKLSDRSSFEERLRPLLRPLYSLAVAEVESRQAAGELDPGAVDPVEVVDEIVARAYEAFRDGSVTFPLKTWLVARMAEYLDEVSAADRANPVINADVHLEERYEKQEPWDAGSPGDDKLDFEHLDEALHLEDVFPDLALTNPEEVLSAREQMRFIHRILRELPRLKRQSFLLHADGFDDVEIAMVQHRPEHEVRQNIEEVRQMILKQLGLSA